MLGFEVEAYIDQMKVSPQMKMGSFQSMIEQWEDKQQIAATSGNL